MQRNDFRIRVGAVALAVLLGHLCAGTATAAALVGMGFFDGKIYDVDETTGMCTNPRTCHWNSPTTVIRYSTGLTQDVDGTAYVLTTSGSYIGGYLWTVDLGTGAMTPIGDPELTRIFEGDIDIDPTTGVLYGMQDWAPDTTQTALFTLNKATGTASVIADLEPALGSERDFSAMAFNAAGELFVINNDTSELLKLDKADGSVLSRVDLSVSLGNLGGMDFQPGTGQLYVVDGGDAGTDLVYTCNTTTGALTEVGPTYLTSGLCGLRFLLPSSPPGDANGDGCVDGGDYTLWADHYGECGVGLPEGDFTGDGCVNGGDYTIWADNYGTGCTAIPEPSSAVLVALGVVALIRRRR